MELVLPPDEERRVDDSTPLLYNPVESQDQVPVRIARRLYVSHFLSTWNSRVFEFGAVLYLATVFPGTLLPLSVYALTRGLSAIVFASAVGQYVDTGNRLQVVRVSIGERAPPYSLHMLSLISSSLATFCCSGILRHLLYPRYRAAAWTSRGNGHACASVLLGLHRKAVLHYESGLC